MTADAVRAAVARIPPGELWADLAADVPAASDLTGISRTELWALMKAGALPWKPVNGRGKRVVPRRALRAILEAM